MTGAEVERKVADRILEYVRDPAAFALYAPPWGSGELVADAGGPRGSGRGISWRRSGTTYAVKRPGTNHARHPFRVARESASPPWLGWSSSGPRPLVRTARWC